jgi:transposase
LSQPESDPFYCSTWQPITRAPVFGFIIAVLLIRAALAMADLLFAPRDERRRVIPVETAVARFWYRRFIGFAGSFPLVWVAVQEAITLGFSIEGQQLIGYSLGLGVVGIGWEAIWRRPITAREDEAASSETHQLGRTACNVLLSVRAAIAAAGAQLFLLPPYSPDMNPIEMAFAKLKTLLRQAPERTRDCLWHRIGVLLDHSTPDECANYLGASGYADSF